MLGIAGMGYQMLRLAEPAFVPPVLTLSAPSREHRPMNRKRSELLRSDLLLVDGP
jgi:hypothetical protein